MSKINKQKAFYEANFSLIAHAKGICFAISQIFHFNQFSVESKDYHGHPVPKKLPILYVVVVLYKNLNQGVFKLALMTGED